MLSNIERHQKKRRNRIKYNIHGFNQIEAIKMGLSIDDLAVLRWFIDFQSSDSMERNYIEDVNDMGFWVDYSTLIDALPILLSDGMVYLERFVELEKLIQEEKIEEYKIKKKKYHSTNRKKVQRILSGPLSQVLKKDEMKVISEKGSKIFVYIDRENYSKLLLNTNMQEYLFENGIDVDTVDNINHEKLAGDKSVSPGGDKSVSPAGDKSVSPGGDKSVSPGGDKSVSPNSSINNSSISYSSINNSSITHSKSDRVDLSFFYRLNYDKKLEYLMNKFDCGYTMMINILDIVDMGISEGTIKSKLGSKGYWKYIYKICEDQQKKRLIDSETINKS